MRRMKILKITPNFSFACFSPCGGTMKPDVRCREASAGGSLSFCEQRNAALMGTALEGGERGRKSHEFCSWGLVGRVVFLPELVRGR